MATTARAATPHAEAVRETDTAPRTPTSLPSTSLPIAPTKPVSPVVLAISSAQTVSPRFAYKALSPHPSPRPLTGAAALADAQRLEELQKAQAASRHTSPNPRFTAVNALLGRQEVSKASDGPPTTTKISEPVKQAISKIVVPVNNGQSSNTSPTSTISERGQGSSVNGDGTAAMTATAAPRHSIPQLVEEPESMDDEGGEDDAQVADEQQRPFTYPGPPGAHTVADSSSRRDLSYDSGSKGAAKRHKCPYCATDFTRHHNLKSHLLTHSQEKPYVCQTCSARFRRLHDLKRHSKLHTGERPHICPKCGRKFARGDALARHNKGPGGCANRKSSFGGEDDDGMDDTMDGLEYDNEGADDQEDDEMVEAQTRRVSEPNRKRPRPDATLEHEMGGYRQQSSTYPPPQMARTTRPDVHAMGPPPSILSPGARMSSAEHGHVPQQHLDHHQQAQYYPQPAGSTYSLPHVTESPRPLSPRSQEQQRLSVGDASALRNRSPSLNSSFQSQQYGRGSVSGMAPHAHMVSHAPQLPSLGSLAGPHQSVQPTMGPSYSSTTFNQPQHGSNPGSHSSHGHSSTGSIREMLGSDPGELMSYVRNLEQRFSRMQDEYELRISRLQSDVIELKKQMYKGQ